jgi:hypothetical protein
MKSLGVLGWSLLYIPHVSVHIFPHIFCVFKSLALLSFLSADILLLDLKSLRPYHWVMPPFCSN